jgi:hypothetical protein
VHAIHVLYYWATPHPISVGFQRNWTAANVWVSLSQCCLLALYRALSVLGTPRMVRYLTSACLLCARCSFETAFAKKHWVLTWAHEFTKHRRKAWHLCLLSSFALNRSLLQPPWNQGRTRMIHNIFTQGTESSPKDQWSLAGQTTPPNWDNYLRWWDCTVEQDSSSHGNHIALLK